MNVIGLTTHPRAMYLLATPATGASVVPAPSRHRAANTAVDTAARPSARCARFATVARAFGFGKKRAENGKGASYNDEGNLAGTSQGNLEKKRCDLCLGTGLRKCYNCHVGDGWREKNFSTSKCERAGYVPIKVGGFMGFGGKEAEEKCGVCWNNPAKKPGQIQCVRCGGKKFIYYRNADWR